MHDIRDWQGFRNVLCIRPDNLGDVLMTTPAIRALKLAVPDRRMTLLTSRAGSGIAEHIPEVDDAMTFDPPWYRHDHPDGRMALDDVVARLSRRSFDAAVIFTVFSQNPLPTAMLCYMAGIRRVAAYCRENPYALLSEWLPDTEPLYRTRHEVQRQLDLVTYLGAKPASANLSLAVPSDRDDEVRFTLRAAGVNTAWPWLLMHAGASEARRCYPAEGFAAAAQKLYRELGMQVVLTGSAAEHALADSIARAAGEGVHAVAGRFDLGAFISLIAMSPLVISNNTGPVHIAAAVQTPVVVLYAQTNPQHTPWHVAHRVLPFGVPPANRSRNILVRYAADRFYSTHVPVPDADAIVAAADDLLDLKARANVIPLHAVQANPASSSSL